MFVYRYKDKLYNDLRKIHRKDERKIVIYPVYYKGYENNMNSEEVIYSEEEGRYVSDSKDGTWLDIIHDKSEKIYKLDVRKVFLYEEYYYHCEGDLMYHLLEYIPEYHKVRVYK